MRSKIIKATIILLGLFILLVSFNLINARHCYLPNFPFSNCYLNSPLNPSMSPVSVSPVMPDNIRSDFTTLYNSPLSIGYYEYSSDKSSLSFIGKLIHVYRNDNQILADIAVNPKQISNNNLTKIIIAFTSFTKFSLDEQNVKILYPISKNKKSLLLSGDELFNTLSTMSQKTMNFNLTLKPFPLVALSPEREQELSTEGINLNYINSTLIPCNTQLANIIGNNIDQKLTCTPYIWQASVYVKDL